MSVGICISVVIESQRYLDKSENPPHEVWMSSFAEDEYEKCISTEINTRRNPNFQPLVEIICLVSPFLLSY